MMIKVEPVMVCIDALYPYGQDRRVFVDMTPADINGMSLKEFEEEVLDRARKLVLEEDNGDSYFTCHRWRVFDGEGSYKELM